METFEASSSTIACTLTRADLADVAAQVAANRKGGSELLKTAERFTEPVVRAYMNHVQDAAEQKVRQAVAYATDRESVRRVAFSGTGRLATHPLGSGWAYDSSLDAQGFPFDLDKAKQALDASGFGGQTFKFTNSNDRLTQNIAQVLQATGRRNWSPNTALSVMATGPARGSAGSRPDGTSGG